MKKILADVAGLIPVIKAVMVTKQVAFDTAPFAADLVLGDRYYKYFVTKKKSGVYQAIHITKEPLPPYVAFKYKIDYMSISSWTGVASKKTIWSDYAGVSNKFVKNLLLPWDTMSLTTEVTAYNKDGKESDTAWNNFGYSDYY